MNNEDINDIILKAKNGDEKSMDFIFEKYKPVVTSISRKYFLIGGTIEDVIQEGNIGLFKAITSFDPSKNISFLNFSKMCIERNLLTAINKANNLKNLPLNSFESLTGNYEELYESFVKDKTPSPEEYLISNEILDDIKKYINTKLSSLEKNVLKLFLNGESYKDISNNLKITTKCVDNTLERIRKKLSYFRNSTNN